MVVRIGDDKIFDWAGQYDVTSASYLHAQCYEVKNRTSPDALLHECSRLSPVSVGIQAIQQFCPRVEASIDGKPRQFMIRVLVARSQSHDVAVADNDLGYKINAIDNHILKSKIIIRLKNVDLAGFESMTVTPPDQAKYAKIQSKPLFDKTMLLIFFTSGIVVFALGWLACATSCYYTQKSWEERKAIEWRMNNVL